MTRGLTWLPLDRDNPRDETERKFWSFLDRVPNCFELFSHYSFALIEAGRKESSATLVFERVRWDYEFEGRFSDDFMMANDIRPLFARWWMQINPQHDGFFETRARQCEMEALRANRAWVRDRRRAYESLEDIL